MPNSVERAIADLLSLEHPDVAWTPPAELPTAGDLRTAIDVLTPPPVGIEHATWCLGKLMLAFGTKLDRETTKLQAALWIEACGDLGDELWSKATMMLIRSWRRDDHYGRTPEPSDFRAAVATEAGERAKKLDRCRKMLGLARDGAADSPSKFKHVPQAERLRKILAEQQARTDQTEAERLFNMSHTERALAMHEKRAMAHWAQAFFDARVEPAPVKGRAGAVTRAVVRETTRAMEQAAVDRWQAGKPLYHEEPPPPTDVAEGVDYEPEIEP